MKTGDLVHTLWFGDEMLGLVLEWVDPLTPGLEAMGENTWLVELVDNGEKVHRVRWELEIISASR